MTTAECYPTSAAIQVSLLLAPRFSMQQLMKSIEWMQQANQLADKPLFQWCMCSEQGQPVLADNNMLLGALRELELSPAASQLVWFKAAAAPKSAPTRMAGLTHWLTQGRLREVRSDEEDGQLYQLLAELTLPKLTPQQAEQLLAQFQPAADTPLQVADNRVYRALQLMQQYQQQPLTMQQLAQQSYLSVRQLERLFRRYFDQTPSRYYTQLRLQRAHQLLQRTNLSVTEVSQNCGFNSLAHFCKLYKQAYAVTPSQHMN